MTLPIALFVLVRLSVAATGSPLTRRSSDSDQPYLDYFNEVCAPFNSSVGWDPKFPCNLWNTIYLDCIGVDPEANLTFAQQQACFCANPWADAYQGCTDCALAHGVPALAPPIEPSAMRSWTSSYCSATATAKFDDELDSVFPTTITWSNLPTTWTDPIGNKTAVSLYLSTPTAGSMTSTLGLTTISTLGSAGHQTAPSPAAATSRSTSSSSGPAAKATIEPHGLGLAAIVGGFAGAMIAL